MNVTDLADEIYRELDYPEDLGIPNIVFFLTSNIGQLNVLIGSSYSLTQNNQIDPELGIAEAVILKYIYFVHYYNRLVRSNLGASAYDFSEISEGDTTIRRASRNEIDRKSVV